MFNGSHSRSSYPFDKRIPKSYKPNPLKDDGSYYYGWNNKLSYDSGFSSAGKQVSKDMHKKKQRQHNRKLEKQID